MTDKKKKIEKYKEAEEIGKESDISQVNDLEKEPDVLNEDAGADEDLGKKLREAETEAKETHDKYLRLYADFENYKKRSIREMQDFRKYATETLLKEMLKIVDNLALAIQASTEHTKDQNSIVEGIDMTQKQVLDILEKHNVTPIESVGNTFDPRYHEAFLQEESEEHPDNTVIRELQKGYMLHDRLLRPAVVAVSKSKKPDSDET
jgi:molecular chaperone GrpE